MNAPGWGRSGNKWGVRRMAMRARRTEGEVVERRNKCAGGGGRGSVGIRNGSQLHVGGWHREIDVASWG